MIALRRLVLAALLLAGLAGDARADGCYIPEKAIVKLPEIPAQRALVAWRDGRETLIVESRLEGQGRKFGWIVPVPNRPESIEAVTPGALKSLAMGLQPRIVHDLHGPVFYVPALCLAFLLFTLIVCWGKRTGRTVVATFLFLVLANALIALALPSTLAARRGSAIPDSVNVLDRDRVGSYDVVVLAADDADALYAWLKDEDLAVPEVLRPAVDDYAKRGWKFVTARLVTDGSGVADPHPLKIVFAAEQAVYPMKLTGLSGRALDLELYVAGDSAADAPGMQRVFCDRFDANECWEHWWADHTDPVFSVLEGRLGTYQPNFRGESSGLSLGHPGFASVLWPDCWVSKLTGRIEPGQMAEDYRVTWSAPRFERQKFYSRQGASQTAWIVAVLACALMSTVLLGLWALKRLGNVRLLLGLLAATAASWLLFGAVRLALPQVETSGYGVRSPAAWRLGAWYNIFYDRIHRRGASETTRQMMERLLAEEQPVNLYTGEPVREEDSPGNYTVAEEDGRLLFTLYDLGGTPVTVELETADKPDRGNGNGN